MFGIIRYRNSLGHDVSRLGAAAIKRRYPPGMVPGQELEEITLVQSDIEGSTEIWEWYTSVLLPLLQGPDRTQSTSTRCVMQQSFVGPACHATQHAFAH